MSKISLHQKSKLYLSVLNVHMASLKSLYFSYSKYSNVRRDLKIDWALFTATLYRFTVSKAKLSSRHCEYWAGVGECDKNRLYMSDHCSASCNTCSDRLKNAIEWTKENIKSPPSALALEAKLKTVRKNIKNLGDRVRSFM